MYCLLGASILNFIPSSSFISLQKFHVVKMMCRIFVEEERIFSIIVIQHSVSWLSEIEWKQVVRRSVVRLTLQITRGRAIDSTSTWLRLPPSRVVRKDVYSFSLIPYRSN